MSTTARARGARVSRPGGWRTDTVSPATSYPKWGYIVSSVCAVPSGHFPRILLCESHGPDAGSRSFLQLPAFRVSHGMFALCRPSMYAFPDQRLKCGRMGNCHTHGDVEPEAGVLAALVPVSASLTQFSLRGQSS